MTSPKGERIPFPAPIRTRDARGCVEKWLIQVEENMRLSVRDIIDGGRDLVHIVIVASAQRVKISGQGLLLIS